MKKFLLVVYGAVAESEAQRSAGMGEMAAWYGSLGSALVDPGAPFVGGRTVTDDGVGDAIGPNATGYSMLQADSMEAATALVQGCPLLKHGRMLTVFETLPMG